MTRKSEAVSIDANIILRYLLGDHKDLSVKAANILEGVEACESAVMCDPVNLAEVVWVLSSYYKLPNKEIYRGLEPILKMDGFLIPNKDRYLLALKLFAESVRHFGDACACAGALQECSGKLYSFDAQLSEVSGIKRFESVI